MTAGEVSEQSLDPLVETVSSNLPPCNDMMHPVDNRDASTSTFSSSDKRLMSAEHTPQVTQKAFITT